MAGKPVSQSPSYFSLVRRGRKNQQTKKPFEFEINGTSCRRGKMCLLFKGKKENNRCVFPSILEIRSYYFSSI
jgi:hypothetical protein